MPGQGKGRSEMRYRGALFLLASVAVFLSSVAIAAEPETPLDTAKRLADSKEQKDRAQALQLLKGLGKPGTAPGDEALARYGDLCLRFYAEGEKAGLEEAKRAFTELKEKAHSRWGLKSKVGLLRVAAAEGKRDEAIRGLDWFLANQGKDDASIEAAYYLGCVYAQQKDDLQQIQLSLKAWDYSLKLFGLYRAYYTGDLAENTIRGQITWAQERIREIKAGPLKLAFEKAEAAKAAGKHDEAIKLYEWIIKEDPAHELAQLSGLRICECVFLKSDAKTASRQLLQGIYDRVPFPEVKRDDYDWSVRAPQ
jgi:tetratricopeptide (TPR) repeat protein